MIYEILYLSELSVWEMIQIYISVKNGKRVCSNILIVTFLIMKKDLSKLFVFKGINFIGGCVDSNISSTKNNKKYHQESLEKAFKYFFERDLSKDSFQFSIDMDLIVMN